MAHDSDSKIPEMTRRRLLKLAAWTPPAIVSLTAMRAHAGRASVTAGVKADSSVQVKVG